MTLPTPFLLVLLQAATPPPAPAPPTLKLSIEARLSYTTQSGNTDADAVLASLNLGLATGIHRIGLSARMDAATNAGERQQESYKASAIDEIRFPGTPHGVYAKVSWQRNTFSGIEHRWKPGVGYLLYLVEDAGAKKVVKARLGIQYRRTEQVGGETETATVGQIGVSSSWPIRKDFLTFRAVVDVEANLSRSTDHQVEASAGLNTVITKNLDLFTEYSLVYDNEPVPGFKKTDTKLTTGISVKF